MQFRDRREAGRELAAELADLEKEEPVVLALPRGGVPVAFEVALALRAPLDVLVVRKVGAPHNPEYGVGAIGEGGVLLLNDHALARLGLSRDDLQRTVDDERSELRRRVDRYRGGRPAVPIEGRTAVVVDDGLATGVSATAAVRVLRERGAGRVVVAVPVGAPDSVSRLEEEADAIVCLHAPASFMAVGSFYRDFGQTTDDEVVDLLSRSYEHLVDRSDVRVDLDGRELPGYLWVPPNPAGLVVFAHGSGSSRESPRNQLVAGLLNAAGFATLLFDLLTEAEAGDRSNVFDIPLLAGRLAAAARWAGRSSAASGLPVGMFGASTGAAAALTAAAELGDVRAVVSRGGRPDLCDRLGDVRAPTLLIVGGDDEPVIGMNRQAADALTVESEIAIVEGAGHLFEGPGQLEEVSDLAGRWFRRHLR